MSNKVKIELGKKGVFQCGMGSRGKYEKRKVASAIRLRAIGMREPDGETFARIRFRTIHGNYRSEFIPMSDLLPERQRDLKCKLADRGYRWPQDLRSSSAILDELAKTNPGRTFRLVNAPGWHGIPFVLTDRIFSPDPTTPQIFIDPDAVAHIGAFIVGEGALQDWQEHVATPSRLSRCLRLIIGAAFAAPFLRLLEMDSFGINFFSQTSDGKTLALYVGASVAGLNGPDGLPGWADFATGLEDLFMGHRDCLMPLDEQGDGEHQLLAPEKKAQMLAFAIARNRPRKRSKLYERNNKLENRETRNIVISTSERAMGQIAREAGGKRLGGEEVRLIDVPASDPESQGILDGRIKQTSGVSSRETARNIVERLKANSIRYQGHAFRAFLDRYVHDPQGFASIKRYKGAFEREATMTGTHNAHHRVRSNFAVIYAAAALAIDYEILPWKKRQTCQAIEKCMRLALDQLEIGASGATSTVCSLSSESLCRNLHKRLADANIVPVTPKKKPSKKQVRVRRRADGFKIKGRVYIKPIKFKRWFPSQAERQLLKHLQVVIAERDDTATVEKKIGGITGKPRYYVVDALAMRRLIP